MKLNVWYWLVEYPPKYFFARSLGKIARDDPELRMIIEKRIAHGKESLSRHERRHYGSSLWLASQYASMDMDDFGLKVAWGIPVVMFFLYFFEIL